MRSWTDRWIYSTLIAAVSLMTAAASAFELDDALQTAGMTRHWAAQIPLRVGDSVEAAYLVDDVLYVISDSGFVFALQADSGLIRWAEKVAEPGYVLFEPSHLKGRDGSSVALLVTAKQFALYDRFNGNLLQTIVPRFAPGGSVVGSQDEILAGSTDGRLYCLTLNDPRSTEPLQKWEAWAGGAVTSRPILRDDGNVIVAVRSGSVFSCRAADKALNWSVAVGGSIEAQPGVDESGVYVPSTDRSLYKLDEATGRTMWRARLERPLSAPPHAVAHTVFQPCADRGLLALDAHSGKTLWRRPDALSFVAHQTGRDVLLGRGVLEVVGHAEGNLMHSVPLPSDATAIANLKDDAVFVLQRGGRIHCARPQSEPYLRRQQVIAARGRLNLPPLESDANGSKPRQGSAAGAANDDPFRSQRDRKP